MKFKDLKVGDIFNTKLNRYIKTEEIYSKNGDDVFNCVPLYHQYAGLPYFMNDETEVLLLSKFDIR